MSIEDLTLKQIKELMNQFSCGSNNVKNPHPATSKYVLVRTYSAGVHVGILTHAKGTEVTLTDSRRIWSWSGALSCSEIAQNGITGGKLTVVNPVIFLTEVIEIIPITSGAEKCLREFK